MEEDGDDVAAANAECHMPYRVMRMRFSPITRHPLFKVKSQTVLQDDGKWLFAARSLLRPAGPVGGSRGT